jgi:hypothetical protein
VALICLLLASLIGASLLKLAAAERRQLRREQLRLQAGWLAESAASRAAAHLAVDPKYAGEVWELAPDEFGGTSAGRAEIRVETVADQPGRRRVRIQADYPASTDIRARHSQQWTMDPEAP